MLKLLQGSASLNHQEENYKTKKIKIKINFFPNLLTNFARKWSGDVQLQCNHIPTNKKLILLLFVLILAAGSGISSGC